MTSISDDFECFLYVNYPADYRKATADGVGDDVINAIVSRYKSRYEIWKDIPQWIKDKYRNDIPDEVLNGNVPVEYFVMEEVHGNDEEQEESIKTTDRALRLLALGYSAEVVAQLVQNATIRDEILKACGGGELSEEQKRLWRETRENDIKIVEKDMQENHPEKYMLHLFKTLNREYKRAERTGTEVDVNKISSIKSEIDKYVENISTKEDREKVVEFLKGGPQQKALSHFSKDALEVFTKCMHSKGIVVEPSSNFGVYSEFAKESLANDLRADFEYKEKIQNILMNKYKTDLNFRLPQINEAVENNIDGNKLLKIYNNTQQQMV